VSKRARHYLVTAITALLAFGYSWLMGDPRNVEFYAGLAGLITLVVAIGLPFVELPKDPYPRLRRSRG
jgi:hypothetical protein